MNLCGYSFLSWGGGLEHYRMFSGILGLHSIDVRSFPLLPPGRCDNKAALLLLTAKSFQLCPTLRDPIDGSPPGSPVPGILQARTLKWVVLLQCMKVKSEREVAQLCPVTPGTAAHQAPPSMELSRQEYWRAIAFSDN